LLHRKFFSENEVKCDQGSSINDVMASKGKDFVTPVQNTRKCGIGKETKKFQVCITSFVDDPKGGWKSNSLNGSQWKGKECLRGRS